MDLSRSPDLFAEEPLLLQENESQEGGLSYHRDSDSISFLFMFHVVILSLNFATNAMSAWTSRGSNLKISYKFGFLFRLFLFFFFFYLNLLVFMTMSLTLLLPDT